MIGSATLLTLFALASPAGPAEPAAAAPIPRYLPAASEEIFGAGEPVSRTDTREAATKDRAARRAQRNGDERPPEFWWAGTSEKLEAIFLGPDVPISRIDPNEKGCCKLCNLGKACGDTCIAYYFNCTVGPGCACQRPLGRGDFFDFVPD